MNGFLHIKLLKTLLIITFLVNSNQSLNATDHRTSSTRFLEVVAPSVFYSDSFYNMAITFYADLSDSVKGLALQVIDEFQIVRAIRLRENQSGTDDTCAVEVASMFSRSGELHSMVSSKLFLQGTVTIVLTVKTKKMPQVYVDRAIRLGIVAEKEGKDTSKMYILYPRVDYLDKMPNKDSSISCLFRSKNSVSNYALNVSPQNKRFIVIPKEKIPPLSFQSSFDISFSFRTIKRNHILLSTWSGFPGDFYPLEMMVENDGKLKVYSGDAFSYYEMSSSQFVATGEWIRVHVSYDVGSSGMRLYLDEKAQDSLLIPDQFGASKSTSRIFIGSRSRESAFFDGWLDDIRVQIANEDQKSILEPSGRMFYEDFEDPLSSLLAVDNVLIKEDFQKRSGKGFQVKTNARDGQLLLEWTVSPLEKDIGYFVVEKSLDGNRFEEVATILFSTGVSDYTYSESWAEREKDRDILFYRVTQMNGEGVNKYRKLIKLGFQRENTLELFPNFPNPFSFETKIEYKLNVGSEVQIILVSSVGKEIARIHQGYQSKGTYNLSINVRDYNLSNGVYFISVVTMYSYRVGKLIVLR